MKRYQRGGYAQSYYNPQSTIASIQQGLLKGTQEKESAEKEGIETKKDYQDKILKLLEDFIYKQEKGYGKLGIGTALGKMFASAFGPAGMVVSGALSTHQSKMGRKMKGGIANYIKRLAKGTFMDKSLESMEKTYRTQAKEFDDFGAFTESIVGDLTMDKIMGLVPAKEKDIHDVLKARDEGKDVSKILEEIGSQGIGAETTTTIEDIAKLGQEGKKGKFFEKISEFIGTPEGVVGKTFGEMTPKERISQYFKPGFKEGEGAKNIARMLRMGKLWEEPYEAHRSYKEQPLIDLSSYKKNYKQQY